MIWYLVYNSIVLIFLLMLGTFIVATYLRNNSIVDIIWGLGFVLIAFFSFKISAQPYFKQILVTSLIFIWGIRLSLHLFIKMYNQPEDYRYVEMRSAWGSNQLLFGFFQVFMLQGLLIILIALPIIYINSKNIDAFNFLDIFALMLWLFGFYFEVVGDHQLRMFKKTKSGDKSVLNTGLWAKTRHPNYFGEFCMIWAMFIFALSSGGYWTIISPIILSFLLLRVSGVPMIERRYRGNEEYEAYKKITPIFFPKFR